VTGTYPQICNRYRPVIPDAHKSRQNLLQRLDDGVGVLVGLGLAAEITGDVL
jgi:hypothetical protein